MNLMDVYQKLSGAPVAEKTAAAGQDPVDVLIETFGLKDQVKTAEDRELVKAASNYIRMGVELARETWAKEVLGGEKTAEEKATAAEKTAAEKPEGNVEKLLTSVGIGAEKTASDKAAQDKAAAEAATLKEGALRELVAVHLVPAARGGNQKAAAALKKIASSGDKAKALITEAVKSPEAMKSASAGMLGKYLASKRGEKK